MPSEDATWLISVPADGDSDAYVHDLAAKLGNKAVAPLAIPSFKTGTLDSLISLSDDLPKQESFFTATVAKTVDTLRNLLNNDPVKLGQHILVDEAPLEQYLFNWKWNDGRYGIQRSLAEMVDTLNKEMASIDNTMKAKLNNYNLVKGSLVQMQRKRTGNLSVKSLADVVSKDDFVLDSEYLETLLVAVPRNLTKEWTSKYERLTPMIVPRSSKAIASDSEYTLYSVVVFRKIHDEFVQKCRENKFILRDFAYSEEELQQQRQELETTKKELWTELLRLSRTNFSESFQVLVHLKVVRLFVESVLRYGLPASYTGIIVNPDAKNPKKSFATVQSQFAYLRSRSKQPSKLSSSSGAQEDFAGEYQSVMEQEFHAFVLFEIPWITA